MTGDGLITMGQAAEMFGVRPHTIGDLVRLWEIQTKPMINGRARGLDYDALKLLARQLNFPVARVPRLRVAIAS